MNIKNILQESIYNNLLLEAKSPEEVYNILCQKYDGVIKPFIIKNIMNLDPTKKFSYTQWALKSLANSNDAYNVDYLKLEELFNFAAQNNDFQLQTFNSIDNAYQGIFYYKGKSEYEVVYEDEGWIIYVPNTYAAERYIVHHLYGGASWCTASSNGDLYFKRYNEGNDRLYIFANKKTNEIYQYSPQTGEFHDSDNEQVDYPSNVVGGRIYDWFEGQGMDIDEGSFPGEYDIYDGGDYGLKCINDLYAIYVLVDSHGHEVDNAPVVYQPVSIDDDYENSIVIKTKENDVRNWSIYEKETHKCIGDFDDTYGEPYFWGRGSVFGLNSNGDFEFVSLIDGVEYDVPSWEAYDYFDFVGGIVVLGNTSGYYELYNPYDKVLCSYIDKKSGQSYYVRFDYEPSYDEKNKVFIGEDEEGYEIIYNPATKELQSEKDELEAEDENEEAYSMSESRVNYGKILRESLEMLLEGANIWDVYEKYYADKIDKETYEQLASLDPTSKNEQKGKYLPWIINQYLDLMGNDKSLYKSIINNIIQKYGGTIKNDDTWVAPFTFQEMQENPETTQECFRGAIGEINSSSDSLTFAPDFPTDGNAEITIRKKDGNFRVNLYEFERYLSWYNTNKNYLPEEYAQYKDINKMSYKDLESLYKNLEGRILNPNILKKNINVIYDDAEWVVYNPLCYEAERYIVWHMYGGASWCTAASEDARLNGRKMFEDYTSGDGRLFIFVRKSDEALFQLSDSNQEFRNSDNDTFPPEEINLSENVITFFNDKMGIDLVEIIGDPKRDEFWEDAYEIGDSGMYFYEGQLWWDYGDLASPEGTEYKDDFNTSRYVILAPHYGMSDTYDIYLNQDAMTGEHKGWHLEYADVDVESWSDRGYGFYCQINNYFGYFETDEGWYNAIDNVKYVECLDYYNVDGLWLITKEDGSHSIYCGTWYDYDNEITAEDIAKRGLEYFGEAIQEVCSDWIVDLGPGFIKIEEDNFGEIKKLLKALNYIDVKVEEDESDNSYLIIRDRTDDDPSTDYEEFAREVGERLGLQYGVEDGIAYILLPKSTDDATKRDIHNIIKNELGINYHMMPDYDENTLKLSIEPVEEYSIAESIKNKFNVILEKISKNYNPERLID